MADRVGFTLLEALLALGIAALAIVLLVAGLRPIGGFVASYASSVRALRAEAAVLGRSVAIGPGACSAAHTTLTPETPVATRVRMPIRGLLFTPDGLPRTCDGGGVGNTTILLEHRGRQAAVIVSSLGRVRWELR